MRKKACTHSNEILEINPELGAEAQNLVKQLRPQNESNVFIEIDCAPNGHLNPFNYGNGQKSAMLIKELSGSFLGEDRAWLGHRLFLSQDSKFTTDLQLGEELGLWQKISSADYETKIDWGKAFCVKNAAGVTRIWHPDWRHFGHNRSFSTRGGIVNFIYGSKDLYLQPFYLPLPSPNGEKSKKVIYRLVFFCGTGQTPELIGGLWIGRDGFKVYPGKDAVIGLISPQKVIN